MMTPPIALTALHKDRRGAAAVEFALIAPALLMVLLGLMDLGHNLYSGTLLEGAIQKAARDATIEGASATSGSLDATVEDVVDDIVPGATVDFSRKAYTNFQDVSRPEDFTDTNTDGVCNDGEPFEDVNGNKTWDADRGANGLGGARDAVLYTVTVTYDRPFPLLKLLGFNNQVTQVARTVLRNQPYGLQNHGVTVEACA
ncbi:MAG: hypothetical protein RLZZ08_1982 [Pseudomonadota bacterium]|jgi:Flp pilus assembly protein TadG